MMLSNIFDRISFWSIFTMVVLLPIFFLPFLKIPIETGKGLVLVAGITISIISFVLARFFDGKINLPKSKLITSGFLIALAFLISALFSSAVGVSFFGTIFDTGTFFYILSAFLLMLLSFLVIKSQKDISVVFWGFLLSSFLVLLFQALHLFFPEFLSLGILPGKTDNVIGSWNELGIFAGMFSLMSIFIIEFFPLSRVYKYLFGLIAILSIVLSASVNFPLIWILLGIFSLIIFIYKISLYNKIKNTQDAKEDKAQFPVFSLAVAVLSLLLFLSGQIIGGYIPNKLGLSNVYVSPSFSSTMSVAGKVLEKNPAVGIGPNRFGEAWARYKPESVNSTIFWNTNFNSGSGVLPTFAITTGGLGILALLLFFGLFLTEGGKFLLNGWKGNVKKEVTAFLLLSLYLFVSSFFFSIGPVLFFLAFAFAGIFARASGLAKKKDEVLLLLNGDPQKNFLFIGIMVLLIFVSIVGIYKYMERFASVSPYSNALSTSTVSDAESSIIKAISLNLNDLYLRTYSQIYLSKINLIVSNQSSSVTEQDMATLQASFDQAVNGALLALSYDKNNYLNFNSLGSVYSAAGILGVEGAYDKAFESYQKALTLNPLSPGIKLSLARVSFAKGKITDARNFAGEAISLKPDYIDALILLSQIESNSGNKQLAITYATRALSFDRSNTNIANYLSSLKTGNSSSFGDDTATKLITQ